jgi:hypothetical protein
VKERNSAERMRCGNPASAPLAERPGLDAECSNRGGNHGVVVMVSRAVRTNAGKSWIPEASGGLISTSNV